MEDPLALRRSRRSNAGNRLEAVIADYLNDGPEADQLDDIDFVVDQDEVDAFESDFESTDDEAEQAPMDEAAESVVAEDERSIRKAARSKLDKITATAHARQKATFHPEILETSSSHPAGTGKLKRRVSLGIAVDAETGEVVECAKRKSRRTHTMLSTSATASRLRDAEERKSAVSRKVKAKVRAPTQSELIARALDMEEGNITEHRDYLSIEEEKRKRARLVRTSIRGPLLRFVTKAEEVRVKMQPPPGPAASQHSYSSTSHPSVTATISARPFAPPSFFHPSTTASQSALAGPMSVAMTPMPIQPQQGVHSQPYNPLNSSTSRVEPLGRIEKVAKNYLVHELGQAKDVSKPSWLNTMQTMFGDHTNWDELRVYMTKGRPLARPTQICPISGRSAWYLDPESNVPFADVAAYKVLRKVLAHEYVWSEQLGCFFEHLDDYHEIM